MESSTCTYCRSCSALVVWLAGDCHEEDERGWLLEVFLQASVRPPVVWTTFRLVYDMLPAAAADQQRPEDHRVRQDVLLLDPDDEREDMDHCTSSQF